MSYANIRQITKKQNGKYQITNAHDGDGDKKMVPELEGFIIDPNEVSDEIIEAAEELIKHTKNKGTPDGGFRINYKLDDETRKLKKFKWIGQK